MDIVKMVWHCSNCNRDFNRRSGERHKLHSDHTIQRQLVGLHKKDKGELLSTDDIFKGGNVKKQQSCKKKFDSRRILKKAFMGFVKEEQEENERFLSWIKQKREEFVIRSRFGEEFVSQSQEN